MFHSETFHARRIEGNPMTTESVSKQLHRALTKIDRPGSFCSRGSVSPTLPGLTITDIGTIALPLSVAQAKQIKKVCEQAPYGKGEKTVIDTKVRKVWQLMPDRFELTNPAWQDFLQQTLTTVQNELGLQDEKLECSLYNLLLYEKGSFFLPHRDGEKAERMVATLVIVLPSQYQGGELVIRHDGKEETIDFTTVENGHFLSHFAAFYADCEHEIRPLKSGYRLCLIYNVTLAKSKKRITAPRSGSHIEAVANILQSWIASDAEDRPDKLAITLDHQYSKDGLSWDTLKGVDRVKADVMREVGRRSGCVVHLAILTLHESGAADEDEQDWGYDDEEGDSDDYDMAEDFDSELTADDWIDDGGNPVAIGELSVEENEVVSSKGLDEIKPEVDVEGFTGNEGLTIDHWYRHVAIFLWSAEDHFARICEGSLTTAIDTLHRMLSEWKKRPKAKQAEAKAECVRLARQILTHWRKQVGDTDASGIFAMLEELDELVLFQAFFQHAFQSDPSFELPPSFLRDCEKHGWASFTESLTELVRSATLTTLKPIAGLVGRITSIPFVGKRSERLDLVKSLTSTLFTRLVHLDTAPEFASNWEQRGIDRSAIIVEFLRATNATGDAKLTSRFIAHIQELPERYPLLPTQINALTALRSILTPPFPDLAPWLAECRHELEGLTGVMPTAPVDFVRAAPLACSCATCKAINQFLLHPTHREHRIRAVQPLRTHAEQHVRRHNCDLDCDTDRKGSPHTLVLAKNTMSYQVRLNKYHDDMRHLETIKAIQSEMGTTSDEGESE